MFDNIFNVSGSIYALDSKNFKSGQTGWSAEVISEHDEMVVSEQRIDNVLEKIEELAKNRHIELYRYPKRPEYIPLDNSDLIPKVIRWFQRGLNIDIFFTIYPEVTCSHHYEEVGASYSRTPSYPA